VGFIDQRQLEGLNSGTDSEKAVQRENDRALLLDLHGRSLQAVLEGEGRKRSWSACSSTDLRRQSFSQKTVQELGERMGGSRENLGFACKKGLKPEAPNQDSFLVVQAGPDLSIYGVFDGHGPCGHDVSEFAKNMLVKVLLLDPLLLSQPDSALENAFQQTQRLLEQATEVGHLNAQFSGTTATVVLHLQQKGELWTAHVGDSRAVLGRRNTNTAAAASASAEDAGEGGGKTRGKNNFPGQTQGAKIDHLLNKASSWLSLPQAAAKAGLLNKDNKAAATSSQGGSSSTSTNNAAGERTNVAPPLNINLPPGVPSDYSCHAEQGQLQADEDGMLQLPNDGLFAVDLTQDHKPDDPAERERIENAGGRVIFDGFYNYRVYAKAGRYPGLNMSRALGDLAGYYDAGISPVPTVSVQKVRSSSQTRLVKSTSTGARLEHATSSPATQHAIVPTFLQNTAAATSSSPLHVDTASASTSTSSPDDNIPGVVALSAGGLVGAPGGAGGSSGSRRRDPSKTSLSPDIVDEFLLLCSDGIWEFMSSQESVEFVNSYLSEGKMNVPATAEVMAKECFERWQIRMMGQVVDDITAVIVKL